ncbi:MAG: hypothetical protein GY841_08475 [FCB group bacterium]|nr:hypothetical protein [FCB group bacterium]
MKKTVIFTVTFLAVFGLVAGLTVFSADPVTATELCDAPYTCFYRSYCSADTGPQCANPRFPNINYFYDGECSSGNPGHICPDYTGCCNKDIN